MFIKIVFGVFVVVSVFMMVVFVIIFVLFVILVVVDDVKEKCFGVVMVGKNDCVVGFGMICVGIFKVNYQGNFWKYVVKGICIMMKLLGDCKGLLEVLKCDLLV